ncbi:hypothetical protein QQP08_021935 [Theobroma cacao]|nr:hypothetical protein QQP08_021935 [Theobroma cacao]
MAAEFVQNRESHRYGVEAVTKCLLIILMLKPNNPMQLKLFIVWSRSSEMAKGLIWATAEDLARNRGKVVSLYRQILRSLNSPILELSLAARLAKKAEARAIFMLGSEEHSLHNIEDLIDAAEYSLSLLKQGKIPKLIQ